MDDVKFEFNGIPYIIVGIRKTILNEDGQSAVVSLFYFCQ